MLKNKQFLSLLLIAIICVTMPFALAKPPTGGGTTNPPPAPLIIEGFANGQGIAFAKTGDGFIKYANGAFNTIDTTSDLKAGYDKGKANKYDTYRTYAQFDVSGLSSAASIENAVLKIKVTSDSINTANKLRIEYLAWDGTLSSDDWSISPRETISDSFPSVETVGSWETVNITTQLRDAVLTRGESVFSIRIKHDTESDSIDNFMTWNSAEDADKPYLNISYTEASAGTLAVLMNWPNDNMIVAPNDVFNVSATVSCTGASGSTCSIADAYLLYGASTPNTLVGTTSASTPFYALGVTGGLQVNSEFSSAGISDIAYDASDDTLWTVAYTARMVEHRTTSGNMISSFSVNGISNGTEGVTVDTSDDSLWVCDIQTDGVYHFSKTGTYLGGFSIQAQSNWCLGITYDSSDDTLWVLDYGPDYMFHYDKSGNLLSDGFSIANTNCLGGRGVSYDARDDSFWIINSSTNIPDYVCHISNTGIELNDGFALSAIGVDFALADGIALDTSDYSWWITDYGSTAAFTKNIGLGSVPADNPQSQLITVGDSFGVYWNVQATGSGNYELAVKANSTYAGVVSGSSTPVTVCIGSSC